MNGKKLFFKAVLMVLWGCGFEPHEEFISDIQPPEAITVTFELNSPVFNNPYYLLEPTNFHIKLQDTTYPLVAGEVVVGSSVFPTTVENNRDLVFLLDPNQLRVGSHTVLVRCFLDTKSGSLANRLGAEKYVVDQTFEIRIDPTPAVFDSFKAEIENGFLTFKWKNRSNQQNYNYKIHRNSSPALFSSDTVISDPQINQYIDYGYIGGNLNYKVTAKGFGFEKVLGEGSISNKPADFVIKRRGGQAVLSWTARNFAGENHELSVRPQYYFSGDIRVPFTSSGEIELGYRHMSQSIDIFVDFYSRNNISRKNTGVVEYHAKPNLKPFSFFRLLGKSNKLLIGNSEMLYRFSLEDTIKVEDSLRYADLGLVWTNYEVIVSQDESRIYFSGKWDDINESKFIKCGPA